MDNQRVGVLSGDGIGPEIIEATGFNPEWVVLDSGLSAVDKGREPMPDGTVEAAREIGTAIKGPTTTPSEAGHVSANVRPTRTIPGVESNFSHMDSTSVRRTKAVCLW